MQAPARSPSDLEIANGAETALFIPKKAKDTGTPKRYAENFLGMLTSVPH